MDVVDRLEKTQHLGKDFLVWLWFKSEKYHGIIDIGGLGQAEIRFNGKFTLEAEDEELKESITCSGVNSRLREARLALREKKKVTKAGLRLILGDDEFNFSMDSRWMNFISLKTPKVVMDTDDDPQGLFYEKVGLLEKAIAVIDNIFVYYLKLRVSPEWDEKELPLIKEWIRKNS